MLIRNITFFWQYSFADFLSNMSILFVKNGDSYQENQDFFIKSTKFGAFWIRGWNFRCFCQPMILRIFSLKLFANFVQKVSFRFFSPNCSKAFFSHKSFSGFFLKGPFHVFKLHNRKRSVIFIFLPDFLLTMVLHIFSNKFVSSIVLRNFFKYRGLSRVVCGLAWHNYEIKNPLIYLAWKKSTKQRLRRNPRD